MHIVFLRHNIIAHLIDYSIHSVNITPILGNQNICVTHFTGTFALFQWSNSNTSEA